VTPPGGIDTGAVTTVYGPGTSGIPGSVAGNDGITQTAVYPWIPSNAGIGLGEMSGQMQPSSTAMTVNVNVGTLAGSSVQQLATVVGNAMVNNLNRMGIRLTRS